MIKDNPQTTKERLLNAAQKLMLAKGFTATSLDEVCKSAKVTKGSFFHYFTSKDNFGQAVTEHYWQSVRDVLKNAPFQKQKDPLKRIYGLIDFLIELSAYPISRSCILGNFSQELSTTHPHIRSSCAQSFAEYADDLKADLDKAKSEYGVRRMLDTQSLADFIIVIVEGSLILTKAKQDTGIRIKSLQHLKQYLKNIFEKK